MKKKRLKKRLKRIVRRGIRPLRYALVFAIVWTLDTILLLLPYRVAVWLGGRVGWLAWYVLFPFRRRALSHLELAFGDRRSLPERKALGRQLFVHLGRSAAEMAQFPKLNATKLSQLIKVENAQHLLQAYEKGRGVIGLTAHLGNWELLAAYLAQVLKVEFRVVAREMRNPLLDWLLTRLRSSVGVKAIRRQQGSALLRCLRRNQGIGVLGDLDTKGEGIYVEFLEHPSFTQTGPARLARRVGCPLVPMFIVRERDGLHHRIIFEPPLLFASTDSEAEDIRDITQHFTHIIEEYVKKYADQWLWLHRRWKQHNDV